MSIRLVDPFVYPEMRCAGKPGRRCIGVDQGDCDVGPKASLSEFVAVE